MTFLEKLIVLSAILVLVKSNFPLDFEEPLVLNSAVDENYRIPENLDPIHFDVEITPYFETPSERAFTFDGIVTILVQVRNTRLL